MFAGNFAPAGWALCNGQPMDVSENETLFALIGTTYGGNVQDDGSGNFTGTFNMPDLQGRVPIHMGNAQSGTTYVLGQQAGVEQVTLTVNQIPNHNHAMLVSTGAASSTDPQNQVIAQTSQLHLFTEDVANRPMAANTLTPAGGSQPHDNMQPYLCLNFIISLFGIFPIPS